MLLPSCIESSNFGAQGIIHHFVGGTYSPEARLVRTPKFRTYTHASRQSVKFLRPGRCQFRIDRWQP